MAPPLMCGGSRNSTNKARFIDDEDVEEPLMYATSGLENMGNPSADDKSESSRVVKLVMSFIAMVFFGLGNKVCIVDHFEWPVPRNNLGVIALPPEVLAELTNSVFVCRSSKRFRCDGPISQYTLRAAPGKQSFLTKASGLNT